MKGSIDKDHGYIRVGVLHCGDVTVSWPPKSYSSLHSLQTGNHNLATRDSPSTEVIQNFVDFFEGHSGDNRTNSALDCKMVSCGIMKRAMGCTLARRSSEAFKSSFVP